MKAEDLGFPAERHIDIGEGVTITLVEYEGDIVGLHEAHKDRDGNPCHGFVKFDNAPDSIHGPKWKVESLNPLTLSPSILCRGCGHHGFIRNGRWVSA